MTQAELWAEHDRLFKAGAEIVRPLMALHGISAVPMTGEREKELRRGMAFFERVVEMNPANWAAMWMLGKACQRLKDFERALGWFSRAEAVNPANPDVGREAGIAAMELGRPVEAAGFCERALAANPGDPGLRANLALATLFSGDAGRAAELAAEALRADPEDQITGRIARICGEVLSGKRGCPRHVRDLG